jgi:hypothetical protein
MFFRKRQNYDGDIRREMILCREVLCRLKCACGGTQMKRIIRAAIAATIICGGFSVTVSACPECRARVQSGIYNQDFSANLLAILLPILILTTGGIGLYFADPITEMIKREMTKWQT